MKQTFLTKLEQFCAFVPSGVEISQLVTWIMSWMKKVLSKDKPEETQTVEKKKVKSYARMTKINKIFLI